MLQKFDERNRDIRININGELIHRDRAGISPFDSIVQGGDGSDHRIAVTDDHDRSNVNLRKQFGDGDGLA